jgi:hypothetical protein
VFYGKPRLVFDPNFTIRGLCREPPMEHPTASVVLIDFYIHDWSRDHIDQRWVNDSAYLLVTQIKQTNLRGDHFSGPCLGLGGE